MEENRVYTISFHSHYKVEADTIEEALDIVVNKVKDAIHYTGDRADYQSARVTISGDEDELLATMEAEWKKGLMHKVETTREVF